MHATGTRPAVLTEVWEHRMCPREYSGVYHEQLSAGDFTVCRWPSRQGYSVAWWGTHAKLPEGDSPCSLHEMSGPFMEALEQELENQFMEHVPLTVFQELLERQYREGHRDGAKQLQHQLRDLLNAAPLEP